MSTLKKIFTLYKPFIGRSTVVTFLLIISTIMAMSVPYLFGRIVTVVTAGGNSQEAWLFLLYAGIASVGTMLITFIKERYEARNVDWDVRHYFIHKTLNKTNQLSVSQHLNENSGRIQSVVMSGEDSVIRLVSIIFYEIIPMFITISVTSILIFLFDWRIGASVVISILILIVMIGYFHGKFKNILKELDERIHERNTRRSEILRNFTLIKMFGSSQKTLNIFFEFNSQLVADAKETWVKIMGKHLVNGTFVHFIRIVSIGIALTAVLKGRYDIGIFITLFGWVQSSTSQLDSLYRLQRQLTEIVPKIDKYLEFLDTKTDVIFGKHKVTEIDGHIEFKDVVYTYRNKGYLSKNDPSQAQEKPTQALSGLSFKIEAGQTVALVGPSGAGKSTIVQMLLGAYLPEKGEVLVDGKSLKDYNIDNLRQFIGYVPQQIDPFDDTIRANIELGLPENKTASKEVMQKTIEIAALTEVLERSPKGLETKIGEKGIKLSGGERQRLGIARALIRDPRILIFDEATSSLDTKNEHLITKAVEKIAEDRTTIIIAHRLATVAHADKIIFIKGGVVAAEGTHQELLASSPDYRELVEHQLVLG